MLQNPSLTRVYTRQRQARDSSPKSKPHSPSNDPTPPRQRVMRLPKILNQNGEHKHVSHRSDLDCRRLTTMICKVVVCPSIAHRVLGRLFVVLSSVCTVAIGAGSTRSMGCGFSELTDGSTAFRCSVCMHV